MQTSYNSNLIIFESSGPNFNMETWECLVSNKHRINSLCITSNLSGILARAVLCKWAISVKFWLNYLQNTFRAV